MNIASITEKQEPYSFSSIIIELYLPIYALVNRDLLCFYRQKSRLAGALLQPLLFWLIIGSGMNAFVKPSVELAFSDYFYPGILLMVILFTAIFSTITVIQERHDGFLQGVMIAPISPAIIVLGKVLASTLLAFMQSFFFLPLLLLPSLKLSSDLSLFLFLGLLASLFLIAFMLSTFSLVIAWLMDSIQGYHALMTVLIFPLWILSGAIFPAVGIPELLRLLMDINPLSHGLILLQCCFQFPKSLYATTTADPGFSISYLIIVSSILFALATYTVYKRRF